MKNDKRIDGFYTYENGVLRNKFNIRNSNELFLIEGALSLKSLRENISTFRKMDPFKMESILDIHKILFNQVYDWVGEVRTVAISKGNTLFCLPNLIVENLRKLFDDIPKSVTDVFQMYLDMNIIHPFREGNGRTGRIWLNSALEKMFGKHIDFTKISPNVYMALMIKDDIVEFEKIFNTALIDVSSLDSSSYEKLFMHNAKASYEYEGYYFDDKASDIRILE